jgi:hypothetical protein
MGFPALDHSLYGGIPDGTLVVLESEPDRTASTSSGDSETTSGTPTGSPPRARRVRRRLGREPSQPDPDPQARHVVWQPSVETILQKNVAGLATTTDRTGLCPDETLELEIGKRLSVDDGRDISL